MGFIPGELRAGPRSSAAAPSPLTLPALPTVQPCPWLLCVCNLLHLCQPGTVSLPHLCQPGTLSLPPERRDNAAALAHDPRSRCRQGKARFPLILGWAVRQEEVEEAEASAGAGSCRRGGCDAAVGGMQGCCEERGGCRAIHPALRSGLLLPPFAASARAPRALPAACSLPARPAPLQPALVPSGMLSNLCPICLPGAGANSPGSPSPGNPPQSPRGHSRTRPLPHPAGQGPLASWSPKAPDLPLPCAAAPQRKGNTGTQLLEAAFPMGPPSQSPVLLVHLGNCADKRRQKQLVALVTAGGSAFLWKHQSRDKNNPRQCRGAVCPCLRPGPSPCPCLSSELLF